MSDIYQFNVGGTTYNLANLGLLAPVQITLTADRLYNTGDQFIYTGLLYEATETIAQGTSITIGSNAQLADCVTKQISEINSKLSAHVSVTATGTETYGQLLARLYSLIDRTKLTPKSVLYVIGLQTILQVSVIYSSQIEYGRAGVGSGLPHTTSAWLGATGAIYDYYNNTYTDFSANVASGSVELWY